MPIVFSCPPIIFLLHDISPHLIADSWLMPIFAASLSRCFRCFYAHMRDMRPPPFTIPTPTPANARARLQARPRRRDVAERHRADSEQRAETRNAAQRSRAPTDRRAAGGVVTPSFRPVRRTGAIRYEHYVPSVQERDGYARRRRYYTRTPAARAC